jgi:hypothetical protein
MTSAQAWIVGTLVLLLIGRLVGAITAKQNVVEALLNFGPPAVISAAAGGLAVLTHKADTLRRVTSISRDSVIAGGDRLRARDLNHFGNRLLADEILVYVVFAIVMAVILWEIKVGATHRNKSPLGALQWVQYIGLGFAVPAFLGVGALYIVYTRS